MNILFLTSAMVDEDFSLYQDNAKFKPNPSNQNFYSKLIRCLAITNKVAVLTRRPFRGKMFNKPFLEEEIVNSNNIKYYYVKVKDSVCYKLFKEKNDIIETAKLIIDSFLSMDFIIVVDSLNLPLVRVAQKLTKLYKTKVVGVLTDNPYNLSNVNKTYAKEITKRTANFNCFLSLTAQLADNINKNKPRYIFEGLVSAERFIKTDRISNYFFFGGSLYERYGVKLLIDAFHTSRCKSKLIIAGSGPLSKYIENIASKDSRILYLNQLSHERVVGYEMGAIANINPRLIIEKIDEESIPSKLIEYMSVGSPIISTKHPKLYNVFKDDLFWFEDCTLDSFKNTLEKFENDKNNNAVIKAQNAKIKVNELYSISNQSELITHFLKSI